MQSVTVDGEDRLNVYPALLTAKATSPQSVCATAAAPEGWDDVTTSRKCN